MPERRIKASDISDAVFLAVVDSVQREKQRRQGTDYRPWALWGYDLAPYLRRPDDGPSNEHYITEYVRHGPHVRDMLPGIPEKVLRAKGQRLIDRGLLSGCMCGCRGDMEVTEAGLALLAEHEAAHA